MFMRDYAVFRKGGNAPLSTTCNLHFTLHPGKYPSSVSVLFQEDVSAETKKQKVTEIVSLAQQINSYGNGLRKIN